jgi:RNA polymerase sigma factor (sigma-70 family)
MSKEYFIFVGRKKVVVSKEVYQAYWKDTNRENYLRQLDRENGLLFFCDLDHDGNYVDNLEDSSVDVEKLIETKERIEALNEALATLNDEEREIIDALYFDEQTTRVVASTKGLHQTSLIRKRNSILKKLKKILEEKI